MKTDNTTEDVSLQDIKPPDGPLGLIFETSLRLYSGVPPTLWLTPSIVITQLLPLQPITVVRIRRHFEIVSGFASFRSATTVCPASISVPVRVTETGEAGLIDAALFELVSTTLLCMPTSTADRRMIYRELRILFRQLRQHKIKPPGLLTLKRLREALDLTEDKNKQPRERHSELSRIMRTQ